MPIQELARDGDTGLGLMANHRRHRTRDRAPVRRNVWAKKVVAADRIRCNHLHHESSTAFPIPR